MCIFGVGERMTYHYNSTCELELNTHGKPQFGVHLM